MADVVVIGGGPGGLATAARLARAGAAVVLLERGSEDRFRVGESLGAEVGAHLRALGAEPVLAVLADEVPFTQVLSAWGGPALAERAAITHPLGHGWHVQRMHFDRAIADWARSLGVVVHLEVGTCRVQRQGAGFLAKSASGLEVAADRVVDASGRGAPATAGLEGRTWLSIDRQVALLARLTGGDATGGLLLESVEAGFWYSAPLADGSLLAVILTDGDLLIAAGADPDARFARLLATSLHTARRLRGATLLEPLSAWRADNGRLVAPRGPGFVAVGDAALATDPLGGNGVARALRSASEVGQGTDAEAEALASRRFSEHLALRTEYHWLEARWPDAPFWARRRPLDPAGRPVDWRTVPITLAPDEPLDPPGEPLPPAAEAWLPRAALRVVERMPSGTPAHRLLAGMRAVAPLEDRRLLVGVQWLVATGRLG